jgi:uncharacterized protein YdcH (DUF465 family)
LKKKKLALKDRIEAIMRGRSNSGFSTVPG